MILLQLVHPYMNRSRANRRLINALSDLPGLIVNDLYEHYPDFYVNKPREQNLLRQADLVIFQFPIYWYAAPALLKQWQEMVLETGFAHGEGGDSLKDKVLMTAVTTGQAIDAYSGLENTINELLSPYRRTALHCGMTYHEPFVVHGIETITDTELDDVAMQYRQLVESVNDGIRAGKI
jgi:glutathione-regulated potassium-efflux system ancillary protein KefG